MERLIILLDVGGVVEVGVVEVGVVEVGVVEVFPSLVVTTEPAQVLKIL